MTVIKYSQDDWVKLSEGVHLEIFNEYRSKDLNRIDFALVAFEDEKALGYITCKEFDSESIYIGFGGIFPDIQKTTKAFSVYCKGLEYLKDHYLRATTLIENTNIPMIKMALKAGLKITGIKNFENTILLEFSISWG